MANVKISFTAGLDQIKNAINQYYDGAFGDDPEAIERMRSAIMIQTLYMDQADVLEMMAVLHRGLA